MSESRKSLPPSTGSSNRAGDRAVEVSSTGEDFLTRFMLVMPELRQRQWPWWEYCLFPLAVLAAALQVILPFLHRHGMTKLLLIFMAVWLTFGFAAVNFDSAAGSRPHPGHPRQVIIYSTAGYARSCIPRTPDTVPGHTYIGRLFEAGLYCNIWWSHTMFDGLGLNAMADYMVNRGGEIEYQYFHEGRLDWSYVWVGALGFLAFSVLPIWLAVWLLRMGLGLLI